jgi:hypothetical protein
MGALSSNFAQLFAPRLWQSQLAMFGVQVQYITGANPALTITVIWKEGDEEEEVSPGRYSVVWVQNSDLGAGPLMGDLIINNGITYEMVLIGATAYGYSRCVMQEQA